MNYHHLIASLLKVKGIGPVQANKLLLNGKQFIDDSNSDAFLEYIGKFLNESQLIQFLESIKNGSILNSKFPSKFLGIIDKEYPKDILATLSKNSPTLLSYLGNLKLLERKRVGFCGSRKASEKGLEVACDCSSQLVENGFVVVSGYASGVDMQTHLCALKNGGGTIIVLAEGINNFRVKKELIDIWDWDRVLVISEFDVDAIWSAPRAMQRNNTIIALSNIMILIEAGETGGSMEAGKRTLELNKGLFAPVYEGMPESAIGNQILIKKGAFSLHKSAKTMRANLSKVYQICDDLTIIK